MEESASHSATTALKVATEVALALEHRARDGVLFGDGGVERDRGNDGDGLSFEVDEDLEELLVDGEGRRWTACCLFVCADLARSMLESSLRWMRRGLQ